MRVLSDDDVQAALSMSVCIEVNEQAFRDTEANVPERHVLPVPAHNGASLFMPAHLSSGALGVKVVSVRPNNADAGLPTVPATILLLDEATGQPSALVAGTLVTAMRTAAGSGVATRLLAAEDARNLVVVGAGAQAREHIEAMFAVRPGLRSVTVLNRTQARAEELCAAAKLRHPEAEFSAFRLDDGMVVEAMLMSADIVCTTTNSSTPVFDGGLLKPGCHVNAVGAYTPEMVEIGRSVTRRAAIVVDTDHARDTGDICQAGDEALVVGTLGDVLRAGGVGELPEGRELTMFKSAGTALQDMATAAAALRAAEERGLGSSL